MNLKEQLRVEIRKELEKLETTDMASLLRGLGIDLGGDSNPLPHEVSWKHIHRYRKIYINMFNSQFIVYGASWSLTYNLMDLHILCKLLFTKFSVCVLQFTRCNMLLLGIDGCYIYIYKSDVKRYYKFYYINLTNRCIDF